MPLHAAPRVWAVFMRRYPGFEHPRHGSRRPGTRLCQRTNRSLAMFVKSGCAKRWFRAAVFMRQAACCPKTRRCSEPARSTGPQGMFGPAPNTPASQCRRQGCWTSGRQASACQETPPQKPPKQGTPKERSSKGGWKTLKNTYALKTSNLKKRPINITSLYIDLA